MVVVRICYDFLEGEAAESVTTARRGCTYIGAESWLPGKYRSQRGVYWPSSQLQPVCAVEDRAAAYSLYIPSAG